MRYESIDHRWTQLTSFEAISDLAKSIGETMAMVEHRLMIDGAECRVNATADPDRAITPSIAQTIFIILVLL